MGASQSLYLLVFFLSNFNEQFCFTHVQQYVDTKLRESGLDSNNEANIMPSNASSLTEVLIFEKQYETGHIITLMNDSYLSLGSELIKFSNNSTKTVLKTKQVVTFSKGFGYKNLGFLLICFGNNICDFYTLSKENNINYIQTIIFQNLLKHFQFFELNKKLHFAMDNCIYQWTETHFDQILRLPNDGLILCNFPSNMDSQIIISEHLQNSKKMVYVHELIDNDFVKLQTFSNLNNIQTVISYVHENVPHVMFLKEHGSTIIYRWTDSELVFVTSLDKFNQAKVSYAYINQTTPVFIVAKMNTISLYQISKTESCIYDIVAVNVTNFLDLSISSDFKVHILSNSADGKTIFSSVQFDKSIIQEDDVSIETNELLECVQNLEKEIKVHKLKKDDPTLVTNILKTRSIKEVVDHENNSNAKIFNGKVIIRNNLHADHFKINKSLFFKNLNRIAWTPDIWLSKSKTQKISGPVIANAVNVRNLKSRNTPLFEDLLFTSSNEIIENPVLITKDITAFSIETPKINGIELNDVYLKNSGKMVLGTKQFKNINTSDSHIRTLNTFETATILTLFGDEQSMKFNFSKNLHIESLVVNQINKINFEDLYSSAYKVGTDEKMEGNLNIETATIHELVSPKISGINSKLFLDKVTPQLINSSVEFRNIDAHAIYAKNLNGDDFSNFAYVTNNDTIVIKGNVRIDNINILGDLHLNEFMSDMVENERILGTNATDLLQIYNRSVKINGNVVINNLILQKNVIPLIGSLPFSYNVLENFWLHDEDQTLSKHVTFKSGISVSALNLDQLNGEPMSNYLHKDEISLSNIDLNLETLVLNGNLITNDAVGCEILLNESVRITGDYFLTGKKIFAGNIGVNKLKTRQINGIDITDLVNLNSFAKNSSKFATIVFKENVSSDLLATKSINNNDLADIWNSALRTNMDFKSEQFIFENLTVLNLKVGDLNGVHFNEYISSIDRIYQLKSVENVFIPNAIAKDLYQLQTINSVPFLDILNHENFALPLRGEYHFNANLFIKDLKVAVVNGINFGALTNELMYRSWSQDISGHHTFNIIQAVHFATPQINSYNLENLIDVTSNNRQELLAPGGIFFSHAQFVKSVYSHHMKCDINKLTNILRNNPARYWSSITVMGDIQMLDEDCKVQQLVNQAVNGASNHETIITGQVLFENVQVKNVQLQSVNGIDIDEIIKDAVLKNDADQIIMGKKRFIKLSAQAAASLENVQIPVINKILISVVNASIIDKKLINSMVIKGRKTFFDGLQADQIISQNISNTSVENFVNLEQLSQQPIPNVKFEKLEVKGNLIIDKINNVDLNDFLNNRLLLSGLPQTINSIAYIDFLDINGSAVSLPSINKILMTDVVFDEETLLESTKTFKNTVYCSGAYAEFVNGRDVSKMYENSIFYDDTIINVTSIRFGSNVILSSEAVTATTINDIDMNFIRDMVDVTVILKRSEIIQHNIYDIREALVQIVQPNQRKAIQYSYVDKATELQINLPNAVYGRASVLSAVQDDLLLHVDAEEVASFCQLPANCSCRNQHTVHVSSAYSVGLLENKGYQRIFTYYNEDIAVNVVTSSVSTSNVCRKENVTDEFTSIAWTIAKRNDSQTSFVHAESIIGYINDVTFFEFNNILYFIISRRYDVQKDTYDVDAIVMRFSQNKDQVNVIQNIPARESSAAKVFYTTAGIILVIDSIPKMSVGTDIDGIVHVYKFNEQLETFEIVRSIPHGACWDSQMLKVDEDSHFILLTCRDGVKVFKYYSEFRNYYLFQVIEEPYIVSATVVQLDAYERASPLLFINRKESIAVFRFRFLSGFTLIHEKSMQGMNAFVPFILNSKRFLFCPRLDASIVLKIVTNG